MLAKHRKFLYERGFLPDNPLNPSSPRSVKSLYCECLTEGSFAEGTSEDFSAQTLLTYGYNPRPLQRKEFGSPPSS